VESRSTSETFITLCLTARNCIPEDSHLSCIFFDLWNPDVQVMRLSVCVCVTFVSHFLIRSKNFLQHFVKKAVWRGMFWRLQCVKSAHNNALAKDLPQERRCSVRSLGHPHIRLKLAITSSFIQEINELSQKILTQFRVTCLFRKCSHNSPWKHRAPHVSRQ
jgi:hypothetical protein